MIDHVRSRGFSLIELITTLAVAAIILTVGVPGFQTMVQNNRMTTDLNRLVTDLNLARMEAIKRGEDVTICKKNTAGTNCDNANTWDLGWIVFNDPDRDGIVDDVEEIIRVNPELDTGITLTFDHDRVTYTSQGFVKEGADNFAGSFVIADARGSNYAKTRTISSTGRVMID
jgi:type IV fimbrial biogenesis protein FimT